jgi:hypothetical protein
MVEWIYSPNPDFLNRLRPPQRTLTPELDRRFVEFWRSRIENIEALE